MDNKAKASQSKRSLRHWHSIVEEASLLEIRRDFIQSKIDALGGRRTEETGVTRTCYKVGRLTSLVSEKADLDVSIAKKKEAARKEQKRILAALDALEDPSERYVLVSRYFDDLDWKTITSSLFGVPIAYDATFESMRRTVMNKHYSALVHLWDIEHK